MGNNTLGKYEKVTLYNEWADHLEGKDKKTKTRSYKQNYPDLINGGCPESRKIQIDKIGYNR